MLQKHRPLTAYSQMYIMSVLDSESRTSLFLHFSMVRSLWNGLFGIFGELWVCPIDLSQFLLTKFRGFGSCKKTKICLVFVVPWCIWLEKNHRIFNDSFSTIYYIWERIIFWESLWCCAHGLFNDVCLVDIQRDWHGLVYPYRT